MITRRSLLVHAMGGAAVLALPQFSWGQDAAGFTLPKLPYGYDALEPHIDAETMSIHHTKHHQAYIDKLNQALKMSAPEWLTKPIAEVVANTKKMPEAIQTAVRNHGGGHLNHTLFWTMMAPAGKTGQPSGDLQKKIDAAFGSTDGLKKEILAKATGQFGSGWAWLVADANHALSVVSTANQDNPVSDGKVPLLGVDVWEHAYYLKYRNQRPAYVEAWFNVINWNQVNELFAAASH